MMPRQLGPTMRILLFGLRARTSCSRARARFADFLETGGDNDRAFHACRDALADDSRNGSRRRRDDRQVDLRRDVANARVTGRAQTVRVLRIYRIDRARRKKSV